MYILRAPWRLLLLSSMCASSATAQSDAHTGAFKGRLSDVATGLPVVSASVEVSALNLRRLTDTAGHFMLTALPLGPHLIRIRRLGYQEVIDTIQVVSDDHLEHAFDLRRIPQELGQIVIAGQPVTFPRAFENAYKRAARGKGYFFTREDILAWNAKDFEVLLNRIPGVHANERGVTFQRCQMGLDALNPGNPRPKVAVYIDGQRITIGANDTSGVYSIMNSLKPHMIQIMEIYSGVSAIPAEFLADACAVIVIWTKRD